MSSLRIAAIATRRHLQTPVKRNFLSSSVVRSFSTMPPSSSDVAKKSMWQTWQDKRTKKSFQDQMSEVGEIEKWCLGAYKGQLDKTANSFKAKIPGLSGMSEVKSAKDGYALVSKMVEEIGEDADVEDLYALTELQKLKIANELEMTMDRLNNEIRNFEAAAQTHRLIKMLKEKDMPIPETPDDIRQLLIANARQLMTKPEQKRMTETMKKSFMNRMRR